MERKVILYISMSLDGYLATRNDDISWLEEAAMKLPEDGTYELGDIGSSYKEVTDSCDSYIVGRKTYEVVMGLTGGVFEQAEKFDCYVITRQDRPDENGVTFYKGSPADLIKELKSKPGKNIYCDGGGEIVKLLLEQNLIDEFIVTVIPIILGDGKRLFVGGTPSIHLHPQAPKIHQGGYVELRYSRR